MHYFLLPYLADCYSECTTAEDPRASYSVEDASLLPLEYHDEIPSLSDDDCDLAVDPYSVAASQLENIEELLLPPMPLSDNPFESVWPEEVSFLVDYSAPESAPMNRLTAGSPLLSPVYAKGEEVKPNYRIEKKGAESALMNEQTIESTPPSPILNTGEDENEDSAAPNSPVDQTSAADSVTSPSQVLDKEKHILNYSSYSSSTDCLQISSSEFSNNQNSSTNIPSEINHSTSSAPPATPPSIAFVENSDSCLDVTSCTTLHGKFKLALSYAMIFMLFCCFIGDRPEENGTYQKTKLSSLKLTRSKTTIISIPGRPCGEPPSLNMDCYCPSCIKTLHVQRSTIQNEPQVTEARTPARGHINESTEAEMMKVYAIFDELQFPPSKRENAESSGRPVINEARKSGQSTSSRRYILLRVMVRA